MTWRILTVGLLFMLIGFCFGAGLYAATASAHYHPIPYTQPGFERLVEQAAQRYQKRVCGAGRLRGLRRCQDSAVRRAACAIRGHHSYRCKGYIDQFHGLTLKRCAVVSWWTHGRGSRWDTWKRYVGGRQRCR